jgi:zinc transport system ATP-binding protein
MSPETLVALEGVSYRYDGDVALDGIDLEVGRGERVAVLGPNGGGKTTLLALLLGLRPPGSGRVAWARPPRTLRRAHVPQFPAFDRHFPVRVREMVAQGRLRFDGSPRAETAADRARVSELIERLDLTEVAGAHLSELSGGELKRALIARALAAEPELLGLDEPTASLDEPSRRRLWELVAELPPSTAIVLATHDLAPGTFAATRGFVVDRRLEPIALDRLHAHELVCGHGHG